MRKYRTDFIVDDDGQPIGDPIVTVTNLPDAEPEPPSIPPDPPSGPPEPPHQPPTTPEPPEPPPPPPPPEPPSPGALIYQSDLKPGANPVTAWGEGSVSSRKENARCWVDDNAMMHIPYQGNYGADWSILIPPDTEEAYLRYLLWLAPGFQIGQGGKLPGFGSPTSEGYGGSGNSGKGWSCRGGYGINRRQSSPYDAMDSRPLLHLYSYDYPTRTYGEFFQWRAGHSGDASETPDTSPSGIHANQAPLTGFDGTITPGRLYEVQVYLKCGRADLNEKGATTVWLNGHRVWHTDNVTYRKDANSPTIKQAWLAFYHGGLDPAPANHEIAIGNVTVSREPIPHGITEDPREPAGGPQTPETPVTDYILKIKDDSPTGNPGDVYHFTDEITPPPPPPPPPPQFTLTVNGGTGTATADDNSVLPINADPAPSGQVFDTWTIVIGPGALGNATSSSTTFTLMGTDATVDATYKAAPPPPPPPPPGSGWDELPGTDLAQVMISWSDPRTQGNPNNIIAWSGGAFDTARDRLYVWGGGHADYSGNEVYSFDVPTRTWARLTDPSDWNGDPNNNANKTLHDDGAPVSAHSHDNVVYNPVLDRMLVCGPPDNWRLSHGSPNVTGFNPATNTWDRYDDTTAGGRGAAGVDAAGLTYLASQNRTQFGVMALDGTWTYYPINGDPKLTWGVAAAVDPVRNVFVVADHIGTTWEADLSNLSAGLNQVGSCPWSNAPGLIFVPGVGLVGWHTGEPYVWDGSTWTALSSGSTSFPDAVGANGVYGRLGYSASEHALVYAGRVPNNVWFYRF